jgi:hypothetical protein
VLFRRRDRPPLGDRLRALVAPRGGWRRAGTYLGHRMRRIPDTPHRIALGLACGVFVSFTPFFGLHFFLAAGLAWAVRANVLASLLGTLFGNPLTFPAIAWVSLALGRRILGDGASGRDFGRVFDAFAEAIGGLRDGLLSLFGLATADWRKLAVLFDDVLLPYALGGLIPGVVAAIAAYWIARPIIRAHQRRRRARFGPDGPRAPGAGAAAPGTYSAPSRTEREADPQ